MATNANNMSGFFQPMRFEADVYDCEVIGKIPADIARVILPFRSSGLHGLWVADDEVDFG